MIVRDVLDAYNAELISGDEAREVFLCIAHNEYNYWPGCTKPTVVLAKTGLEREGWDIPPEAA